MPGLVNVSGSNWISHSIFAVGFVFCLIGASSAVTGFLSAISPVFYLSTFIGILLFLVAYLLKNYVFTKSDWLFLVGFVVALIPEFAILLSPAIPSSFYVSLIGIICMTVAYCVRCVPTGGLTRPARKPFAIFIAGFILILISQFEGLKDSLVAIFPQFDLLIGVGIVLAFVGYVMK